MDAITYFQQAENILQYAASCGKSIDQILIIATLQNKACIYQRIWQQQKSFNYIEAILYNIGNYQMDNQNPLLKDTEKNLAVTLNRKQTLALYHLKFSAVASQIKNHEIALNSAFKSVKNMQQICKISLQHLSKSHASQQNQKSYTIIKQMSVCSSNLQIDNLSEITKKTKSALMHMRKSRTNKLSKQILEEIQSFTIGEVMQIFPVTIEQLMTIPSLEEQLSYIGSIFRALYFSISYFAIATELRLLTPSKISIPKHVISQQFIKSQIYHLNAIYIAAKLIPCPTKYLNHIIKSYSNHYQSDIKGCYDQKFQQNNLIESQEILIQQKQKLKYRKKGVEDQKQKKKSINNKFNQQNSENDIESNKVYKSTKSGKVRNSSAELGAGRSKKSLHKQKSTCIIKYKKNMKKQENINNAYSQQPLDKLHGIKTKTHSTKVQKAQKSINNKSSKSKSKSPSVNLQTKKIKSPSKKQKNAMKFQQEYYLQSGTNQTKKKQKNKKKVMASKINQCKEKSNNEYTTEYLKSSTSKLQQLGKNLKSGIQKERKQYPHY